MQQFAMQDDAAEVTYRMDRRRLPDFGTRRILLVAGFMVCLVVLAASIWSALTGYHSGPPPVIEAAGGSFRVRPENPGGMRVMGQNYEILADDPTERAGQLAPPPELPALKALRASQEAAIAAAKEQADHAARAALARVPPVSAAPSPPEVPAVKPAMPVPPVAVGVASPSRQEERVRRPMVASLGTAPVAVPPPAESRPAPAAQQPAGDEILAQLGALRSERAARAEWQRLSKLMPDMLRHRQPIVMKVEYQGRAVYRLRTGGFTNRAQAGTFCARMKAKGVPCAVAPF